MSDYLKNHKGNVISKKSNDYTLEVVEALRDRVVLFNREAGFAISEEPTHSPFDREASMSFLFNQQNVAISHAAHVECTVSVKATRNVLISGVNSNGVTMLSYPFKLDKGLSDIEAAVAITNEIADQASTCPEFEEKFKGELLRLENSSLVS